MMNRVLVSYTTSRPSNSRNSSEDDKDNTVLYVLVSLFVVILVGFSIIGLVIYKRRSTLVPRIQNNGGVWVLITLSTIMIYKIIIEM